jgi:hypothetical protein
MPNDKVYSCYGQYKKGICIASAANACSNYYTKDYQKIQYNAEIVVWRKHSHQPYIMLLKDVKKNQEIVVKPYGKSFDYTY